MNRAAILALALIALPAFAADLKSLTLREGESQSQRCEYGTETELSTDGSWTSGPCGAEGSAVKSGKISDSELREVSRLVAQVSSANSKRPACKQVPPSLPQTSLTLVTSQGTHVVQHEILKIARASRQSCVLGARAPAEALHAKLKKIAARAHKAITTTPTMAPSPEAKASPSPAASPKK